MSEVLAKVQLADGYSGIVTDALVIHDGDMAFFVTEAGYKFRVTGISKESAQDVLAELRRRAADGSIYNIEYATEG